MNTLSADIVIVGSGVAGAISAYALAKKGFKVLVLEAGPRIERQEVVQAFTATHNLDYSSGFPNTEHAPRPDWATPEGNGYIEQAEHDKSRMEYLRVVGGTTWHWSGVTPRYLPSDFKMKTTYGVGEDWPLTYDDLEPYYSAAEKEMGVGGDARNNDGSPRSGDFPLPPMPATYLEKTLADEIEQKTELRFIPRPAARNTLDYKGRTQCKGFGTCTPVCPSGAQYSAITHIEMAEKIGARVLENMLVDRVIKNENGRVIGVEGRNGDNEKFFAQGKIVILAANGIETAKILLMSRDERSPNGVANASDQVGRNYMDHPGIYCRFLVPRPVYAGRGPLTTVGCYTHCDAPFRNERSAWSLAFYNRSQIHNVTQELIEIGHVPPTLDAMIKDRLARQVEMDFTFEQLPHPDNRITLDWEKRDSSGQPQMRLQYKYRDYEKKSFADASKQFERIVQAVDGEIVSMSEPFSHHHLMGSTKMGSDPKTSVTNEYGQTHEQDNLFIVSSSLFTTGGLSNPTLLIAALALRAADKIKRDFS